MSTEASIPSEICPEYVWGFFNLNNSTQSPNVLSYSCSVDLKTRLDRIVSHCSTQLHLPSKVSPGKTACTSHQMLYCRHGHFNARCSTTMQDTPRTFQFCIPYFTLQTTYCMEYVWNIYIQSTTCFVCVKSRHYMLSEPLDRRYSLCISQVSKALLNLLPLPSSKRTSTTSVCSAWTV